MKESVRENESEWEWVKENESERVSERECEREWKWERERVSERECKWERMNVSEIVRMSEGPKLYPDLRLWGGGNKKYLILRQFTKIFNKFSKFLINFKKY